MTSPTPSPSPGTPGEGWGGGQPFLNIHLPWALVLLGIALRILRFTQGRALWLDEVFLVNNLIHKSAIGLLGILNYRQGAPPLFLLLCKLAITLFGHSEYALRLVPLLAGVVSVPLFYLFARQILNNWSTIAAVALFA
ncbi:MAG TPA: glycosyltransferase family 39 protein, partial [Tepidisphaeraceae bacterium]|nr:glycosyltransferase family 39 protein [Tepidisphaeraceae bacterium]